MATISNIERRVRLQEERTTAEAAPSLSPRLLIASFLLASASLSSSCISYGQQTAADLSVPLANARHLLAGANYGEADRVLRAILATAPDSSEAHFLLGFALLHEQKPAESLREYTQGAKGTVPGPEQLIGVASDYVLMKDYPDAEHWLQAAVKSAPERPLIWYMLGRTEYNLNHWVDAEHSFLTCLRLDPHYLRAEYNLGLVYEAQQRTDAAIAAYKLAISWQEASPVKDAQPYLDLGMLLRRQGKIADALPVLSIAATTGVRNPLVHQELGLAYEQLGRYEEAIAELKAAIALTPKIEALHFFLGRLEREAGHREDSAAEFALAAKLSGTQSGALVPNQDVTE